MDVYLKDTKGKLSKWRKSKFYNFLQEATVEELLLSQIPFFHAVNEFPRILIQLATQIESHDARLPLIENIWEEHGNGDKAKFHSNTFKTFLQSLGWDGKSSLTQLNSVSAWINDLYDSDAEDLITKLAAIEYMYAVISEDVASRLSILESNGELFCHQGHYKKHGELDWEHGRELIEVAINAGLEIDGKLFSQAQECFIQLFDSLVVPTKKQLDSISAEPVSFYFVREDRELEAVATTMVSGKDKRVFTICSGGEHVIDFANRGDVAHVTAFDMNPHQIQVCKSKANGNPVPIAGKFEALFSLLGSFLTKSEWVDYLIYSEELEDAISKVFTDRVLTSVFGNEAVMYSRGDFVEHFRKMFEVKAIPEQAIVPSKSGLNLENIINVGALVRGIRPNINEYCYEQDKITYKTGNMKDFKFDGEYDVIDLSNIGDWMPLSDFEAILDKARQSLKDGGIIIVRRLLGDYTLSEATLPSGMRFFHMEDQTGFYSESGIYLED